MKKALFVLILVIVAAVAVKFGHDEGVNAGKDELTHRMTCVNIKSGRDLDLDLDWHVGRGRTIEMRQTSVTFDGLSPISVDEPYMVVELRREWMSAYFYVIITTKEFWVGIPYRDGWQLSKMSDLPEQYWTAISEALS